MILFFTFKTFFKVGKTVHTFRKTFNEQSRQYEQARQQNAENAERNNRKERARAYLKKVSEDAEFEEISGERKVENNSSSSSDSNSRRSNVSDAKFEEVN